MNYTNEIKGRVTEAAVGCAMRHAGYPVVATGVESLLPMLPLVSGDTIASLALGPEIRLLPDLLILPVSSPARLVEVKYRRRIDRDTLRQLLTKLSEQQSRFPETDTILVRSVSPRGDAAKADDLIRVLPPHRLELLAASDLFFHSLGGDGPEDLRLEPLWEALRPMTASFDRFQGVRRDLLERLVPLIRALGGVHSGETNGEKEE